LNDVWWIKTTIPHNSTSLTADRRNCIAPFAESCYAAADSLRADVVAQALLQRGRTQAAGLPALEALAKERQLRAERQADGDQSQI
jgi:hypothetical protein